MLLYARVLGNYIPMKIHISETLWMRPKLLMDSKQTCLRLDINALYPLILKIQLCGLLTLGASLASIISPSIIEQTTYRGVSIWKSISVVVVVEKIQVRENLIYEGKALPGDVRESIVTSLTSSGSIVETVCWKHVCFLNSNGFRYECCVIIKWWSLCEDWIIKNIFI